MPIFSSPSRYFACSDTPSAVTGESRVTVAVGTHYRIGDRGDWTGSALNKGRGRGRGPARRRGARPLPLAGRGVGARGQGVGGPPAGPRARLPRCSPRTAGDRGSAAGG